MPMQAWRWSLAPMAASPPIGLGAPEGLLYVMAGAGIAEADGGRFAVGLENVLWLGGCPEITLHAGARGLEVLIAQAPGRGAHPGAGAAGAVYRGGPAAPGVHPGRPGPAGPGHRRGAGGGPADPRRTGWCTGPGTARPRTSTPARITCSACWPGRGCCAPTGRCSRLTAGMSALTGPGELHWFVNDSDADFAFVEFWAPPPADTVWPVAGDRCTWAPVS